MPLLSCLPLRHLGDVRNQRLSTKLVPIQILSATLSYHLSWITHLDIILRVTVDTMQRLRSKKKLPYKSFPNKSWTELNRTNNLMKIKSLVKVIVYFLNSIAVNFFHCRFTITKFKTKFSKRHLRPRSDGPANTHRSDLFDKTCIFCKKQLSCIAKELKYHSTTESVAQTIQVKPKQP